MTTDRTKFDFDLFNAKAGEPYRQWRRQLFNYCATQTDKSGSTLADHLLDIDMGGGSGAAPPFPPGGNPGTQAQTVRDELIRYRASRAKSSYGVIVKHIADADLATILNVQYFQNGRGALAYLDQAFDTPVRRSDLRDLDQKWTDASIVKDIGVNEDSITQFAQLLNRLNGDRPLANRHDHTEITEKLLESIADASRHFSESALNEYDALPGQRRFEIAPGLPNAGQRDLNACSGHYQRQWRAAVKSKILTVMPPQRRASAEPARIAIDSVNSLTLDRRPTVADHPSQAPRDVSPTHTLTALSAAGYSVTRGTVTTTDFEEIGHGYIAAAINSDTNGEGQIEELYDADDQHSIDIICDCCRGLGHVRRVCPSAKRYRSLTYAISMLSAAKERADSRAQRDGLPVGGRRPPPRGQRAPFRNQPRRFQPKPPQVRVAEANISLPTDDAGDSGARADDIATSALANETTDQASGVTQPLSFALGELFEDESARVCSDCADSDPAVSRAIDADDLAPSGISNRCISVTDVVLCGLAVIALTLYSFASSMRDAVHSAISHVTSMLDVVAAAAHSVPGNVVLAIIFLLLTSRVAGDNPDVVYDLRGEPSGQLPTKSNATIHFRMCPDSGATTGCMSDARHDLVRVTDTPTNRQVKVASGQKLRVTAIADLTLEVDGFVIENGKRRSVTTTATWHHMLLVRGLDPSIILLSVRKMRDIDGINTYFNDDNAAGVCDCIRLPGHIYVPFATDGPYELTGRRVLHDRSVYTSDNSAATDKLRRHAQLCHAGHTRVTLSDVLYSGERVRSPGVDMHLHCRGCRLGGAHRPPYHTGTQQAPKREGVTMTNEQFTHFGQQIDTDTTMAFPRSFPHGFTGMVNFCDRYSAERDLRFLLSPSDPAEVGSAVRHYVHCNKYRLRDEQIGIWKTDNGTEFKGQHFDGSDGVVSELVRRRVFSIPYDKNSNPTPERAWGVLERGIRCCLAYADDAPTCLWPWAAQQCNAVYHYLATTAHSPPTSPYAFLHPGAATPDLSWAKVLFCDCTVALPERDIYNKVTHRAVDGCHLGYDARRCGHVVYCPSVKRISTFKVLSWREESFTLAKNISADTPVEYHSLDDLLVSPLTVDILPKQLKRGSRATAVAELVQSVEPCPENADELRACRRTWRKAWDTIEALPTDSELFWAPDTTSPSVLSVLAPTDLPATIEEARASPWWPMIKAAMEDEIRGKFVDNRAWDVVKREAWMNVVKSKWVFKYTLNDDGTLASVKARLVACGYSQVEGRDYTEVFAKTLSAFCFRIFCCIVADLDLETDQIDAIKAFTQSTVDTDIYVAMPVGFSVTGHVLKLRKALEGIRQGANLWFKLNHAALTELDFEPSLIEPNLYRHRSLNVIVAVFVDDVIAAFSMAVKDDYMRLKRSYSERVRIGSASEVVPVSVFTGVEISRDRQARTLTLTQAGFIKRAAVRYQGRFQEGVLPAPDPKSFEKLVDVDASQSPAVDSVEYLRVVGAILWPGNMCRPDIAYYCTRLCTFAMAPTQMHLNAALAVLGYLSATRYMGITYGGRILKPSGLADLPAHFFASGGLHAYHDCSWGGKQPIGGYVILYLNGAISWAAKLLKVVADSTAEAEIAVASRAAKEVVAVRSVLQDMGRVVEGPVLMIGDNQAARDIIVKPGASAKTRYFDRSIMLVKLLYMKFVVAPLLVVTDAMVADIFTKALPRDKFGRFRDVSYAQPSPWT